MPEQVIANPVIQVNVDFASVNGQMNQVRSIVQRQGKHIEQSLSKSFIPITNAAIKMGNEINRALRAITIPLAGAGMLAVKKLFDSNTKAGQEAKAKWAAFKSTFDASMSRIGYHITQSKILGRTMWEWLDKFNNLLKRVNSQDIQRMVDLLTKAAITMGLIKGAIMGTKFSQGTIRAIELLGKGSPVSIPLSTAHQAASLGGGTALGSAIGTELAAKAIAEKVARGGAAAMGASISIPNFVSSTVVSKLQAKRDFDALIGNMLGSSMSVGAGNFKGSSAIRDFGSPKFNPLSRMNYFRNYGYPGGGIGTAIGAASMTMGRDTLGVGREFKDYMSRTPYHRTTPPPIPFTAKYGQEIKSSVSFTKLTAGAAALSVSLATLYKTIDIMAKQGDFKGMKDGLDVVMSIIKKLGEWISIFIGSLTSTIMGISEMIGVAIGNIMHPITAMRNLYDKMLEEAKKNGMDINVKKSPFKVIDNLWQVTKVALKAPFMIDEFKAGRDRASASQIPSLMTKEQGREEARKIAAESDMLLPISSESYKESISNRMSELVNAYNKEISNIQQLSIINPGAAEKILKDLDKNYITQTEMISDWVSSLPERIQEDLKLSGFNKGFEQFNKSIKDISESTAETIDRSSKAIERQGKVQDIIKRRAKEEKEEYTKYGKGVRGIFSKWLELNDMSKERLGYTGEKVGVTELTDFATRSQVEWQSKMEDHNKRVEDLNKEANTIAKEMRDALNVIKEDAVDRMLEESLSVIY